MSHINKHILLYHLLCYRELTPKASWASKAAGLPSGFDNAFPYWHRNGLIFFCDLYPDNVFISFETLKNDHNIPRSHYFRFFQICSFTREKFPSFPSPPPRNHIDAILERDPYEKRRVSVIYNMIGDLKPISRDKTKRAWEKDLGVELSEDSSIV